MPGRPAKHPITPQDIAGLTFMRIQAFADVSPRFWGYVAVGLLRYLRRTSPRGKEMVEAVNALTLLYGLFARIMGEDKAGAMLSDCLAHYPHLRSRADWCCLPQSLLFQKALVLSRLVPFSRRPLKRNRALVLRELEGEVETLLAELDKSALSPNPHPHPPLPKAAVFEGWLRRPPGEVATHLLAHYHGTSPSVMHRRLSQASVVFERLLSPILTHVKPTHPVPDEPWVWQLLVKTLAGVP